MNQSNNLPFLYAEFCPDQPTIPQKSFEKGLSKSYQHEIQDQLSQATKIISQKNYLRHFRSEFKPNIIMKKRMPFHESFQALQRERQNKSMRERIENVKNMQQRKKYKFDPIVYPPFFVRPRKQTPDIRIDGYIKKALNNTQWKTRQKEINKIYDLQSSKVSSELKERVPIKKYQYNLSPIEDYNSVVQQQNNPEEQLQLPSPIFHRKQPPPVIKPANSAPIYSIKKNVGNLPQNNVPSILDFIYNNLYYKEHDLQALKSRLMHAYGKEQIKASWSIAMRLLQRDI